MTLASGQRAHAARLLREAEHHVAPTEPLSALLPGLDLADAYAVQQENIARRLADPPPSSATRWA
ncbi:2-hydroxypenta-2,4-dienoate hydratase [Actinobacteria bacterium OV320]|nr:2-hydroxypenta-2,4-dienoate hydratase [Actinobacteria bacterium OV320]